MIESVPKMTDYRVGDLVRVDGGNEVFRIKGFITVKREFELWPVEGPFRIKSADACRLELVRRDYSNDAGGPCAIPERWITE